VVLGAALAGLAAWFFWGDVALIAKSISQSGASPAVLAPAFAILAGVFLLVCFCAALLLIAGTTGGVRALRGIGAKRREEALARLTWERRRADAEDALLRHLPHLSDGEYSVLEHFAAGAAEDPPKSLMPLAGDETTVSLVRKGFLISDVVVDKVQTLHRLSPAAAATAPSFLRDRLRKLITGALESAGEPQRTLLQLFASPDPQAGEPRHALLEYKVYAAIDPLIRARVLARRGPPRPPYILTRRQPSTETILLTPEATPFVEQLILNGEVRRTSVELDLSLVRASSSGSF
jgi:hypothetical protein